MSTSKRAHAKTALEAAQAFFQAEYTKVKVRYPTSDTRTRSPRSGATLSVVRPPTVTVIPEEMERLAKRVLRTTLVWQDPDGTIHREKAGESPRACAAMLTVMRQGLFELQNRRRFSKKKVACLRVLEATKDPRRS
jgi:hypothetical protein